MCIYSILPWRHFWPWEPQPSRKCRKEIRFIKVKKFSPEIRCTIVNTTIMCLELQQSPILCLLNKTSGLDSSCIYMTQKCLDSMAWDELESASPCSKAFWTMWGAVSGKAILKGKYIMSLLTGKIFGIPPPCLCTSFKFFLIDRLLLSGSA